MRQLRGAESPAETPPELTPEQVRELVQLTRASVNLDSIKQKERLPTAAAGDGLLSGDFTQLVPVAMLFLGRTLEIAAGIWASGQWGDRSIRNALAGSASVQAFLFGYVLLRPGQDLPSGSSARGLLSGKEGSFYRVTGHWLARSGLIGLGMYAAGQRQAVVKQALFGGAAIETAVLLWTAAQKRKPLEPVGMYSASFSYLEGRK